jgi:hypothetical protein
MAYESLPLALKRVMARGAAEKDAKRHLCNAIADRKIRLRLCFMWRPTRQDFLSGRDKPTREICYVKKGQIPGILKPSDFDWPRSRIRKPGLFQKIRGPSGSFFGNWRLVESAHYAPGNRIPHSQRGRRSLAYQHRIELLSADVTEAFNMYDQRQPVVPQSKSGASTKARETFERAPATTRSKSAGAKTQGIKEATRHHWPHGIPETLSAKDRDALIKSWFPDAAHAPSVRQIQRVLKDPRSR